MDERQGEGRGDRGVGTATAGNGSTEKGSQTTFALSHAVGIMASYIQPLHPRRAGKGEEKEHSAYISV